MQSRMWFLARVIQHEIDHLSGELCIDKATPGTIISVEEYRKKRKAAMQSGRKEKEK